MLNGKLELLQFWHERDDELASSCILPNQSRGTLNLQVDQPVKGTLFSRDAAEERNIGHSKFVAQVEDWGGLLVDDFADQEGVDGDLFAGWKEFLAFEDTFLIRVELDEFVKEEEMSVDHET